jgi:hypothetical protein
MIGHLNKQAACDVPQHEREQDRSGVFRGCASRQFRRWLWRWPAERRTPIPRPGTEPSGSPREQDDWTELIWLDYPEAISLVLAGEITESTSLAALMKAEALRQRGDWSLPTTENG